MAVGLTALVLFTSLGGHTFAWGSPLIIGLILGPLAEQQLRRALAIGQGDPTVLFTSPIAVGLFIVAAAAFIIPLIMRIRGRGEVLTQLAANED